MLPFIRNTGATQKILVSGSYWDGAWNWTKSDNASVMVNTKDPRGNVAFCFDVHQYLDSNYSGTSSSVVPGLGSTVLKDVTDWARANGKQLFLGEFGFASDSASLTGTCVNGEA